MRSGRFGLSVVVITALVVLSVLPPMASASSIPSAGIPSGGIPSGGIPSAGIPRAGVPIPLLRVGTTFPETSLDPTDTSSCCIVDALSLETLLQLGPQSQLEPELATSWAQMGPSPTSIICATG